MDVNVDSVLEVPHSNHAVVDAPFGLTAPLSVEEVEVTAPAAFVVAVGRTTLAAVVVKLHVPDHPPVP